MSDDEVMRELKAAWSERELVTDSARESAKAAFTWRTIDTELMMLSYDSLLENTPAVRRSGSEQPRTVAFQGTGISLEIELDNGNLLGQVIPGGQACRITLERLEGTTQAIEADESGFFAINGIADSRSVRLRIELAGRAMTTGWLTV